MKLKKILPTKPVKMAREYWKPGRGCWPVRRTMTRRMPPIHQMGASQSGLIWLSLFLFLWWGSAGNVRSDQVDDRRRFGAILKILFRKVLYLCTLLLLLANVFNIRRLGAMAVDIPTISFTFLIFFSLFFFILQIFILIKICEIFKYLTFILFAYVVSAFRWK